jgi:4-hydroxybenzoate polyprenyltransferase
LRNASSRFKRWGRPAELTEDLAAPTPGELLVVDLDGTLVATDTLWESVSQLLRREPGSLFSMLGWLGSGKAVFKEEIAKRAPVDPARLPYREVVLDRIRERRSHGSEIVLATASHIQTAQAVADHLGLFDGVLASQAATNLSGTEKLAAIRAYAGGRAFDYAGNASVDRSIWAEARHPLFVDPTPSVSRAIANGEIQGELLVPPGNRRAAAFRALRARQWVKNALILVPLLLAHDLANAASLFGAAVAFASFCAIASATYLINDLLDIEADRLHPEKKKRPFAAGELPIASGIVLAAILLISGFGLSLLALSATATGMLALYLLCTSAYTLWLKQRLFIDVLLLAGLYTLRVLAGGVAAEVAVSTWLLAFSVFFFLSLALIKRYVELLEFRDSPAASLPRRAYRTSDTGLVETMGVTSGYLSVLVLGLYVNSDDVAQLYSAPRWLWLITPVMLFWVSRIWFLARRGQLSSDPVLFATTDGPSYFAGALIVIIGTLASVLSP